MTVNIPRTDIEIVRIMASLKGASFSQAQVERIAAVLYAMAHPSVRLAVHRNIVDLDVFRRSRFALSAGEYATHTGLSLHLARACLDRAERDGLLESYMEDVPRGRPRRVYKRHKS